MENKKSNPFKELEDYAKTRIPTSGMVISKFKKLKGKNNFGKTRS
jgi:hypothetical protein